MRAAREQGIDLLADARYNDATGVAPIPTGYSQVLFGELFRAAGLKRDETRPLQACCSAPAARHRSPRTCSPLEIDAATVKRVELA
jgi:hypothetical protein